MKIEVSNEMQHAIEHAKANGNKLTRHPGGFWMNAAGTGISFGTTTVRALVARKLAIESNWKRNASGEFPIEITLAPELTTPAR